jgi:hypothetical protein
MTARQVQLAGLIVALVVFLVLAERATGASSAPATATRVLCLSANAPLTTCSRLGPR